MSSTLESKNIVVTGGTGGLGRAVVSTLLDEGAHCHIPAYESEPSGRFEFADHERVSMTYGVDLTDDEVVVDYYAGVGELWGSIHVAGGFAMAPVVDTSLADMNRMIAMNGITCFLCCREAIRAMRARGTGRIVNIASRPAVQPTGGMIAYTASKAMVASMTQSLAEEVKGDGILINAVLPSIIDTPANRAAMPDADHDSWPKPAEIACAIAFLASPANALISGTLVPVYGTC